MLILFAGYDRSGKDSAYSAIKEIEGELPFSSITQIALADHLKDVAYGVWGVTEAMKGTGAEEYYRMTLTKCSEVMKIAAGTDVYFADHLVKSIGLKDLCSSNKLYVCTDGRYDYEIRYFDTKMSEYKKNRFFSVHVTRPEVPPTPYALEHHNFPQYSKFDGHINNEDLETYKKAIRNMIRFICELP